MGDAASNEVAYEESGASSKDAELGKEAAGFPNDKVAEEATFTDLLDAEGGLDVTSLPDEEGRESDGLIKVGEGGSDGLGDGSTDIDGESPDKECLEPEWN